MDVGSPLSGVTRQSIFFTQCFLRKRMDLRVKPAGDDRPLRPAPCQGAAQTEGGYQNSPTILPSAPTSMESAAGTRGRPGMVMISPQIATTNSAPAESRTSRTGMV
jgi:hypothetical protein